MQVNERGAPRDSTPQAADERSAYDYVSDEVDRPELVEDLRDRVDGDVRFDTYTRQLYATDASAYEVTPIGVVFPTDTSDVAAVVSYCAEREIPVLPRGGGTSLAGQAVNEAVVLDTMRYMDDVVDIRPDEREADVEAGAVLEELNAALAPHDLKFAPDPAAGNRSAVGGAIGNNSTGAHSLEYGKTDAYIEECEVVLADGTVAIFGAMDVESLRERADSAAADLLPRIYAAVLTVIDAHATEVEAQFPDLKRNVSGYNFDRLVDEARDGTVNLARLLAGSEGTLAVVTEATLSLEPVPETKSVALLTYQSVEDAVSDVTHVLEHDPSAVELIDDSLIDLAGDTAEFADVVALLPEQTRAALLVEFYADDDEDGREQTAGLVADRVDAESGDSRYAFDALVAHDDEERATFWKLRKSGLPILLSRTSDAKHLSFIEDCAVPPEHLSEFVSGFQEILADNDTFASFYAHAGPGVLHVRPLVNTKSETGLAAIEDIADRVTDMVVEFGGSVSGEHGDGRARTQWNRKLYGETLWGAFRDLKTAFDPDWILNPGQVCGDVSMTENLRFDPDYDFDAGFDSTLHWDNENGFQGMAELCHGCGGCRTSQETGGGVMCPTYRAADEEITSTRGRANMLRQAMSGDLPDDPTGDEFVDEVLDLCIGCKGCAKDCPSEVDMAKMKAEVVHERHQREGASLRDKLFANVDTLARLGSATAPLSNRLSDLPGARSIMEKTVGIARERSLPTFERETLQDWYDARGGTRVPEADAVRRAVLFADTYTNYSHPEIGKAAIHVLEAAGVHVALANRTDSGRPAHSKGFLDRSRDAAEANVAELEPRVADGWDVVLVEPSDAVMFQSDYLDLLGPHEQESTSGPRAQATGGAVESVAANTYGVCEYLDAFDLDDDVEFDAPGRSLSYHGHCHQKATKKDHYAVGVLRRAGYDVDPVDSTCCGMAGSFGYEAEHHAMSTAIGDLLVEQLRDSSGDLVVAPGASCRTQLEDMLDEDARDASGLVSENRESPPTPIEMLAAALQP